MDKKARMQQLFDDGPVGVWLKMGSKKALVGLIVLTLLFVCLGIVVGYGG